MLKHFGGPRRQITLARKGYGYTSELLFTSSGDSGTAAIANRLPSATCGSRGILRNSFPPHVPPGIEADRTAHRSPAPGRHYLRCAFLPGLSQTRVPRHRTSDDLNPCRTPARTRQGHPVSLNMYHSRLRVESFAYCHPPFEVPRARTKAEVYDLLTNTFPCQVG